MKIFNIISNENFLFILFLATIFFVINFWISFLIAKKITLYDIPEKRKIHKIPVLINGGIFLYLNVIVYLLYFFLNIETNTIFPIREGILFFIIISVCFFVGLIDDKKNLRIIIRYSIILFFLLLLLDLSNLFKIDIIRLFINDNKYFLKVESEVLFTSLVIIFFIIMYNLFDGINLQSCLITIFYLSYISFFQYSEFMIILNFVIVFSLLIFFYFNYKNISFLGNSGINILGLIIFFNLVIINNQDIQNNNFDFLLIILMFIIPGLDMIRLFFKRLINEGSPFTPDKNHIHHLLITKFSHFTSSIFLLFLIAWPLLINYYLNYVYSIQLILFQTVLYFLIIFLLNLKKNN